MLQLKKSLATKYQENNHQIQVSMTVINHLVTMKRIWLLVVNTNKQSITTQDQANTNQKELLLPLNLEADMQLSKKSLATKFLESKHQILVSMMVT